MQPVVSTNPDHSIDSPPPSSLSVPDSQVVAGQSIGKYRIVRNVGIGGMAQVFLASRDGPEGFAKPYVIKRILPQYAQDEQFARMFVTEAKVAAVLDHPNIVHVFDFEIENGNYYLVMEYVAGASLANILRTNRRRGVPLGAQIAVEIGTAVAHALAYAHELSLPDGKPLDLVHRDISPGNVLVSRDGAVKLADFGVVDTSMTTTVVGVVNGKWAYMSPEQISGQAVDQRSDLFSLGIVLYEIITGLRLFRGENAAATASRVLEAPVRRPKSLVADLPPHLDHIVMKLLERNPKARYQTAAALAADLEALRATSYFSAGSARLRTLVRTLFSEEAQSPALGTSLTEPVRPSPSGQLPTVGSQAAVRLTGPRVVSVAEYPSGPAVKWILSVAGACLIAAAVYWLVGFR
ncbi:MAG: serine/threonine protein kinase [Deltaproteobacteria bacterium]|nr:serine/threonine protein kinase [Deltaproteobacteria bacterium]